jgi:hypothetical protein
MRRLTDALLAIVERALWLLALPLALAMGATLGAASFGVFARSRSDPRAGCRGACA